MKLIFKVLLASIPIWIFPTHVLALRCGHRIVDIGDSKPKVYIRCGDPAFVETRERRFPNNCGDRGYINDFGGNYYNRSKHDKNVLFPPICHVEIIEVWTYNFGSHKFMRELLFREGILFKINLLEYGY